MPTLLDLQFAVPLCQRTRYMPRPGHPPRVTCYGKLRYKAHVNEWYCTRCSGTTAGSTVVMQRLSAQASTTRLEEAA